MDPLAKLRAFCASLPGTEEVSRWNHPEFRVAGVAYATWEVVRGRPSIAIKVGPEEREFVMGVFDFFPTPYGSKGGWLSAWADGPLDWEVIGGLLTEAHGRAAKFAPLRGRPPRRTS